MLETLHPDPSFHPSPRLAMEAEPEQIAYTVLLSPDQSQPDALAVIDVDPQSAGYGTALSPLSGHAFLQRRYLIIPGIRSSRI